MRRVREENGGLTEFGATAYAMMHERGIRYLSDLARLITEHPDIDHKPHSSSISDWFHGKHAAPVWFPEAFLMVLGIDKNGDEAIKLARVYTFGQNKKLRHEAA